MDSPNITSFMAVTGATASPFQAIGAVTCVLLPLKTLRCFDGFVCFDAIYNERVTTFLLVRHGHTDVIGRRLMGRLPGVRLSEEGRRQAESLPERLAGWKLDAIYSSPLERALETAEALSARRGLPVQVTEAFIELDFGSWSGLALDQLEGMAEWHAFNRFRSNLRAPGGELMTEVQARVVIEMARLAGLHPEQTVAIFSHADVIKAAVLHYAGMPVDFMFRIEISPASLSVIRLEDWGAQIVCLNVT
jgi:broad specificity phosphatase PhoE